MIQQINRFTRIKGIIEWVGVLGIIHTKFILFHLLHIFQNICPACDSSNRCAILHLGPNRKQICKFAPFVASVDRVNNITYQHDSIWKTLCSTMHSVVLYKANVRLRMSFDKSEVWRSEINHPDVELHLCVKSKLKLFFRLMFRTTISFWNPTSLPKLYSWPQMAKRMRFLTVSLTGSMRVTTVYSSSFDSFYYHFFFLTEYIFVNICIVHLVFLLHRYICWFIFRIMDKFYW